MKVTVEEITEITRRLVVTLPAEIVSDCLDEVYAELGKKESLKGFRPGKIPRQVLTQHFKAEAEEMALKSLIKESYPPALEDSHLTAVSPPAITVRHFQPGEDFSYEAVIEIPPKIDPQGYLGLTLTKPPTTPTEGEVQTGLKNLQEQLAQLIPLPQARKTLVGDVVVFDLKDVQQGIVATLGQGSLLPEFEQGLLEMFPGESKRLQVNYPQEWPDPKLAGALMEYEILLHEIKEKKLPELNDDFAKDLGPFTSLHEVRAKVHAELHQQKEAGARTHLSQQIVEALLPKNQFPIPEAMIRVELESMFHQWQQELARRGLNRELTEAEGTDFETKNRDNARQRVASSLLLEAIAHREGLTVTADEVTKKVQEMTLQAGEKFPWKNRIPELARIVSAALLEEKTLDFVVSKAKLKVT